MNNHHPPPDYPGAHNGHHQQQQQQQQHQHQQHHQGRHTPSQARSTLSQGSHISGPPGSVRSGPYPPGHHTMVTVNTDPNPGPQVNEISLNIGYFKTLPGLIKLVELVLILTFTDFLNRRIYILPINLEIS